MSKYTQDMMIAARNRIKTEMRRAGCKISLYEPEEISKGARKLIEQEPELIHEAVAAMYGRY